MVVRGGKAHEVVVGSLGVRPGLAAEPHHGVLVDVEQPAGLADAATILEVLQDGQGLVRREVAVEQRRTLALREALLAGAAVQQAPRPAGAIAAAHADVAGAAAAPVGTGGVEAAKVREVVHEQESPPGTEEPD